MTDPVVAFTDQKKKRQIKNRTHVAVDEWDQIGIGVVQQVAECGEDFDGHLDWDRVVAKWQPRRTHTVVKSRKRL